MAVLVAVAALAGCALTGADGSSWSGPPVPDDASPVPIGTPLAAPPGSGGYSLLMQQDDGSPVGWDPCRPLHYVVNDAGAPPSGAFVLADAVARVEQVTGFVLVHDGATDELPSATREPVQRSRYGDRWAPVLVAWSDGTSEPWLAGDVAGYAAPHPVAGSGGDLRYVTGQVVLDTGTLGDLANRQAGVARARAVVLHELAHLLGLGHVEDPAQLMHPTTTPLGTDFGDGDLRGLFAVSSRPCGAGS
ncbi:matrixin family metalloprotease [Thalassiella azotivora]